MSSGTLPCNIADLARMYGIARSIQANWASIPSMISRNTISPAYRDYIAGSIERLKSRYSLTGKTALDIGCGKGDYLRMLVRAGIAKAIGFDPTFVETNFTDEERRYTYRISEVLRPG